MTSWGTVAAVTVAGLLAACGGNVAENHEAAGGSAVVATGGSAGNAAVVSVGGAGGAAGSPGVGPCPAMAGLSITGCPWQVVLPATGAADGGTASPCTIPLTVQRNSPNECNVAVDCVGLRRCDLYCDAGGESWGFDNPYQPTAIVLSDPLCARITDNGFSRIDIFFACSGPYLGP